MEASHKFILVHDFPIPLLICLINIILKSWLQMHLICLKVGVLVWWDQIALAPIHKLSAILHSCIWLDISQLLSQNLPAYLFRALRVNEKLFIVFFKLELLELLLLLLPQFAMLWLNSLYIVEELRSDYRLAHTWYLVLIETMEIRDQNVEVWRVERYLTTFNKSLHLWVCCLGSLAIRSVQDRL